MEFLMDVVYTCCWYWAGMKFTIMEMKEWLIIGIWCLLALQRFWIVIGMISTHIKLMQLIY